MDTGTDVAQPKDIATTATKRPELFAKEMREVFKSLRSEKVTALNGQPPVSPAAQGCARQDTEQKISHPP